MSESTILFLERPYNAISLSENHYFQLHYLKLIFQVDENKKRVSNILLCCLLFFCLMVNYKMKCIRNAHPEERVPCTKTVYALINAAVLPIRSIDLPMKTRMRPLKKLFWSQKAITLNTQVAVSKILKSYLYLKMMTYD